MDNMENTNTVLFNKEERILRLPEVKARTGLGRSSIYEKMTVGLFPQKVSITSHCVGWLESEITAWINARIDESRQPKKVEGASHAD
jgi:prophage regulatory protein